LICRYNVSTGGFQVYEHPYACLYVSQRRFEATLFTSYDSQRKLL
jgi:hypothetical protein